MTCIVGVIDKEKNCVWMGADSLGSDGYTKAIYRDPKLFRNVNFKNVVMGSTTSFRHIDLLRYDETLFPEIDNLKHIAVGHKYMVTNFIPRLVTLFQDNIKNMESTERGCSFLVGVDNKLFEIQDDYSVLDPQNGFAAVGCGNVAALGSLSTTSKMELSPPERIRLALIAAEETICGVQRPFKIINTLNNEEIIIE